MTRILICRHGNTFDKGDVVTRVGARTDLPLSKSGDEQASALGRWLAPQNSGMNFSRAFCSPLCRTRQTAEAIVRQGHSVDHVETRQFLTEVDYGPDENQPEPLVIARIGAEAISRWDREALPPPGWQVDPENLKIAWRSFLQEMAGTGEDILVVTSNGIARFVLNVLRDIPTGTDIKLKTGAYGVLEAKDQDFLLRLWNQRPGESGRS